jgi:hypothetical protein
MNGKAKSKVKLNIIQIQVPSTDAKQYFTVERYRTIVLLRPNTSARIE